MQPGIKCVVWDLDDTLWRGTLLEGDDLVLISGVKNVVKELDRRGILQSIASKNDHDLAWSRLIEFGLADFFLYPQIGWADKSASIEVIASELGIGLDTFAFVDDLEFERDEVQHAIPQVHVIDAADIGTLLDMPRMRPRFVTDESGRRRQMYQADIRRRLSEEEFTGSREGFLETLGIRLTIRPAGELDLRRAEELTIRTSQLNTTGRFYSYEELNALKDSPGHLLLVADLEDRYGSSGTIGLALIERGPHTWLVKLLVMSCRVISYGIGGIMVSQIMLSAKRDRVRLLADFVANERNRMMYLTYKFHGFRETAVQGEVMLLEHDLDTIRPLPPYVTVRIESPRKEGE